LQRYDSLEKLLEGVWGWAMVPLWVEERRRSRLPLQFNRYRQGAQLGKCPTTTDLGPHLRTPKLRVTPGSTPRIYDITEGVNP
jgi:hypothetical protein